MKAQYKTIDLFGNEVLNICEKKQKTNKNLFTDYKGFTEKFEVKKTTDDCYTPVEVYNAVVEYVGTKIDLKNKRILRPFYPNGDYTLIDYQENDIVIDNPPFSIISKIARFYVERNIKFFLFAPHLTLFDCSNECTAVVTGVGIIYENKANVNTSFVSNIFGDITVMAAPELYKKLKEVQNNNKVQLPKYQYPINILTVSMVHNFAKQGINFEVKKESCKYIRGLDSQKPHKKTIFGGGFLLSEKAAAEKAAAEKAAAEKANVINWEISEREKDIIKSLGS